MSDWTVLKLLEWTHGYFAEHDVPSARLDAELSLSHVLNLKRIDLYLNFDKPVAAPDLAAFKALIKRRAAREPLQYILGTAGFYGRSFIVNRDVLIPRPETEGLVEKVLQWIDAHPQTQRVLDIGTGSGCIAITLALERPQLQITAIDISEAALAVARQNAEALGANIIVTPGSDPGSSFDVIISNPPYIPAAEVPGLQPEVSQFEPHLALAGGDDGLAIYRQIFAAVPHCLAPGGLLALEIGVGQRNFLAELADNTGSLGPINCSNDLNGIERVVMWERNEA